MPNRILKESICTSEDINLLSPQEEVFFYRLIVNCDDYGRLDARIPILKSKLYPLKEKLKSSDIERYLKKLASIKPIPLIFLYINNNIRYLQMVKWEKHQQIRAKRSKYPTYTDEGSVLISHDINGNQKIAYVPVIQSNPIQSKSESESEVKPPQIITPLEKAIEDFKSFRKKIKAPMTDRAIELFYIELNKLATDDDTKIKIIEQSIVSGYKGIFPLKDKDQKGVKTGSKPVNSVNFKQREYDDDYFDDVYENSTRREGEVKK